jgi:hypothetical protein
MTDFVLPERLEDFISKAGDPPQDSDRAMRDDRWWTVFRIWADDKKEAGGDPRPQYLHHLDFDLSHDSPLSSYYWKYFGDDARPYQDPLMPAQLSAQAKDVLEGSSDSSEKTLKDNLSLYVDQGLIDSYRDFCTDVMAMQRSIADDNAGQKAPTVGGASGVDDDWTPDAFAYDDIRKRNSENVKNTANRGKLLIVAGGNVVLIGEGHSWEAVKYVGRQTDVETGDLIVKKAGAFGKGSCDVTGISAQQALVTAEIGEFSEKGVTFA